MNLSFPVLFLIGYRGTGKSSVGQLLARRLGWDFVDADEVLEKRHGKTIGLIFTEEGEVAFRDKEETVLAGLCQLRNHVVATGGGVVLRESNRQRLRENGKVVWLTADPRTIWQRLQNDPANTERRPNLGTGGLEEVEDNLKKRELLYRECADLIVSTDGRSVDDVVEMILNQVVV